jgi:large subunit ribosomal protein L17
MRHGKKFNHLGRKSAHRKAMLSNMANSLIEHKRLETTVTKAKALQQFVEPIITKAKTDTTHSRRNAFRYLKNKYAVTTLFTEVANKVGERKGGYTRIIKTGFRLGDNAELAMIELVDYNEIYGNEAEPAKKKRSRRSSAAKKTETPAAEVATEEIVDAPTEEAKVEEPKAEAKEEKKEDENTEEK